MRGTVRCAKKILHVWPLVRSCKWVGLSRLVGAALPLVSIDGITQLVGLGLDTHQSMLLKHKLEYGYVRADVFVEVHECRFLSFRGLLQIRN
jgi:hypothetical protein